MPFASETCPHARQLLEADLRAAQAPPDVAADALLILSELVGNVLRHGTPIPGPVGPGVGIGWTISDASIEIKVADAGEGIGIRPAAASDSESGRGLHIVGTLAAGWGQDRLASDLTIVWARLERGPAPLPSSTTDA